MAQQTVVEWLIDEINKQKAWANPQQLEPIFEQAKAMEKEQIVKAYISGDLMEGRANLSDAEQYYNETYKK